MPYDYVTDRSDAFAVGRRGNLIAAIKSRYSDPESQSRNRTMTSPVAAGCLVSSE